jgi:hypothetical protein
MGKFFALITTLILTSCASAPPSDLENRKQPISELSPEKLVEQYQSFAAPVLKSITDRGDAYIFLTGSERRRVIERHCGLEGRGCMTTGPFTEKDFKTLATDLTFAERNVESVTLESLTPWTPKKCDWLNGKMSELTLIIRRNENRRKALHGVAYPLASVLRCK